MATLREHYNTGDDQWGGFYSTVWTSQSFPAGETYDITSIKLRIYRSATYTPGTITVSIRTANSSHQPTGNDLALGTTDGDTLPTSAPGEWREITLDSPYTLSSGTRYAILVRCELWDGNMFHIPAYWRRDSSSGYADGKPCSSTDNGVTWTAASSTLDYMFENWGNPISPPDKPISPSPPDATTGVGQEETPLSYEPGTIPGDTYDIYFGQEGHSLTQIADTQDVLSWKMPFVKLAINNYNPTILSGYRSPKAGDILYDDDDTYILYRVKRGDLVNVSYEAELFAFRAIGPGNKSGGDILTNGVAPDVNDPQAVSVTLNNNTFFRGDVEAVYLPLNGVYQWRVDATNDGGTTTGDVWTFAVERSKNWDMVWQRPPYFYDEDEVWQPGTGWVDINDFEYTGGGRYKGRVVVVGHKVIYFGDM